MTKPTVSVAMITYGHEKYIKQAIEGVLMQECDFEIELIITNDCSPDKTDKIVNEIIQNHPKSSWIKYTLHEQNIGMNPNFIWNLEQCEGKYIAICEGDDYWTDTLKLQKQVDLMEKTESYSLCFHNVTILKGHKKSIQYKTRKQPFFYTIKDLAKINFIHTCSVMYKREFMKDILNLTKLNLPATDYVTHMLAANYGDIGYINEPMAVYREGVGVWSSNSELKILSDWVIVLNYLIDYYKENQIIRDLLIQQKVNCYFNLCKIKDYSPNEEDLVTNFFLFRLKKDYTIMYQIDIFLNKIIPNYKLIKKKIKK
jgi:glycosyltransferase involved in cell wall biosynthesis